MCAARNHGPSVGAQYLGDPVGSTKGKYRRLRLPPGPTGNPSGIPLERLCRLSCYKDIMQSSSSTEPKTIIASAPCRADLAGGTLDLWPLYLFHPGAVTVNFALSIL